MIPRPQDKPTLTVTEAAALLGVSRSHAFEMAAQGRLPVLRLGRRVVVLTNALRQMLGLPNDDDD